MSRLGVGIRVLIDGEVIDDGSLNANYGISADDDLQITWGRGNSMEQPSASTCTFRLSDIPGDQYFKRFSIGSSVAVLATGKIGQEATLSAFEDPEFAQEIRAGGAGFRAELAGLGTAPDSRQSAALILDPLTRDNSGLQAILPPDNFQNVGENETAWEHLPQLAAGQTWTITVTIWVPPNSEAELNPVRFTAPWYSYRYIDVLPKMATVVGGGWQTVTAELSPGVDGGWIGLQVNLRNGSNVWQVIDPALSWSEDALFPNSKWEDGATVYLAKVEILAPSYSRDVTHVVFGGRITDMESSANGDFPEIDITASSFQVDLSNRYIGDEPWPWETVATRMARIMELATPAGDNPATLIIADTFQAKQLAPQDVDNQPAWGLLSDIAISVDGVLWTGTDLETGPYVKVEDILSRKPLSALEKVDGEIVIGTADPDTLPPSERPVGIDACDILLDPVKFLLNVSDISTRVSVSYSAPVENEYGTITGYEGASFRLIDSDREILYGTRNVSVETLLRAETDAQFIAQRILERAKGQWRIDGLEITDADVINPNPQTAEAFLTLLDEATRPGQALRISNLPIWAPMGEIAVAYLEGGEYRFRQGGWELQLYVDQTAGAGESSQWAEMPTAWQWDEFAPGVTWKSLAGVNAPQEG